MNKIIKRIFKTDILQSKPPLLVDIGASGNIYPKWQSIAQFSICVAFDADTRDFDATILHDTGYKKLYKVNRIVSSENVGSKVFYLTKSPYCSSTLHPDTSNLSCWEFASLFEVEKTVTLPSIQLQSALENIGYDYIDWFKIDSQGTDLDVFLSLDSNIRSKILAADFEPGIIDAYLKENKLYEIQKNIEGEMWISSLEIKGTKRITGKYADISSSLRISPCWAEITALKKPIVEDLRSQLLLIAFSLIENQWGYALEIIDKSKLESDILLSIKTDILSTVKKRGYLKAGYRSLKSKFRIS